MEAGCRRKEALCNDGLCSEHGDLGVSIREKSMDPRMWKTVLFTLAIISSPAAEASVEDSMPGTLFRQIESLVSHIATSLVDIPAPRGSELLYQHVQQAFIVWKTTGDFFTTMQTARENGF
jgi:hypothetical protein